MDNTEQTETNKDKDNATDTERHTTKPCTLSSSPWKLGKLYIEDVFFINNSDKPQEQYIAKVISLKHLTESQKVKLIIRLKDFQEKLNFEFVLNIVEIIEDKALERLIVVFEYCEGGTLQSLVTRAKSYDEVLNEIEVQDWLVQSLAALQHLDEQDLVHKDICCNNVYLKQNCVRISEPHVLKWLFKKPESIHEDYNSVEQGVFLTEEPEDYDYSFTSPEVLQGEQHTDKSDVWSLGCILYELCARKKLFRGKTAEEVKAKIFKGKFIEGKIKWPSMFSQDLKDIWEKMMETDPIFRPSAFELMRNPILAEHYEEMKENLAKLAKMEPELTHQPQMCRDLSGLPASLRFDGVEYTSDSDAGFDADLELTEEETRQLLNLGRS